MILHRNTKKKIISGSMKLFGRKRSTCDHSCLFQVNFKAVTLAHNTIGSIESHGFAAENA